MISTITISIGSIEHLKIHIDALTTNCSSEIEEMFVICSPDDECISWLLDNHNIHTLITDSNRNYVSAINSAIKDSKLHNDILIADTRAVLLPNSLNMLINALDSDNTIASAGSIAYYTDSFEAALDLAQKNNIPSKNSYEYQAYISYGCTLFRKTAINSIELFDEYFNPQGFEDSDLGLRLLQSGYKNVLCYNSIIYNYNYNFRLHNYIPERTANSNKFKEKWGFNIEYYNNARYDLIELISEEHNTALSILEVGCGIGTTLLNIKYNYPNSTLYGIELVDSVAALGSKMLNIINGNIENMELSIPSNSLDYIIFGDVLEHLHNPHAIINKMKNYLKPNGSILTSIPNIMNASVIYKLLQGNFKYQNSGILDNTHLKFFTKKEIIDMFTECGYSIESITSRILETESTEAYSSFFSKLLSIEGLAPREEFDTFQYIVKASLADETSTIIDFIDSLISQRNHQSLLSARNIVLDDEIRSKCNDRTKLFFVIYALELYFNENLPYDNSFFKDVDCINDCVNKITKYKHLLFSIEFDVEQTTALSYLIKDYTDKFITLYELEHLVQTFSFDKEKVIYIIKEELSKNEQ